MPKYNPVAIRRCVRREAETPDGQVLGVTKSFTRADETVWHPVVDTQTGEVVCDCPDHRFRRVRQARALGTVPNVMMPQTICKHALRLRDNCIRRGELVLMQDGSARPVDLQGIFDAPMFVPCDAPMATGAGFPDAFADEDALWWQQIEAAAPTA